jgi:hypothetical protein
LAGGLVGGAGQAAGGERRDYKNRQDRRDSVSPKVASHLLIIACDVI